MGRTPKKKASEKSLNKEKIKTALAGKRNNPPSLPPILGEKKIPQIIE